jgi:hypothetical protein
VVGPGTSRPPAWVRTVVSWQKDAKPWGYTYTVKFDDGYSYTWGANVEVDVINTVVAGAGVAIPSQSFVGHPSFSKLLDYEIDHLGRLYTGHVPSSKPDDRYPHSCPLCHRMAYVGAGTRVLHAPDDREQCK